MEPNEQPPAIQLPEPNKKTNTKKLITILLTVLLLAGIGFAGYGFGKNQTPETTPSTQENNQTSATADSADTSSGTHFVKSIGYPFDLKDIKSITFNLGLPDMVQGVITPSGNNNHGAEQLFTDKYNDEMGRWSIGYPNFDPTPSASEISILAIGKSWLASTTKENTDFFLPDGGQLVTPAQKQKYIAKVKSDAQKCVNDPAKGFSTKDKVFKVCYKVGSGPDGYDPTMTISGYAEIKGEPFIMYGFLSILDGRDYSSLSQEKYGKLIKDLNNGDIPPATAKVVNQFVQSLSQTSTDVAQ